MSRAIADTSVFIAQETGRELGDLPDEIAVSVHGQYAFGNTLIPQEEDTAGGFYSVRGYPESIVAGDNVVVFTGEYRFHVPRAFSPAAPRSSHPAQCLAAAFRTNGSRADARVVA